jgi:hypothetical protein
MGKNYTSPLSNLFQLDYEKCGSNYSTRRFNIINLTYRSSERKVTQPKITIFHESNLLYFFLIRIFKIEESETAHTYVGKKGILYTSFTSS